MNSKKTLKQVARNGKIRRLLVLPLEVQVIYRSSRFLRPGHSLWNLAHWQVKRNCHNELIICTSTCSTGRLLSDQKFIADIIVRVLCCKIPCAVLTMNKYVQWKFLMTLNIWTSFYNQSRKCPHLIRCICFIINRIQVKCVNNSCMLC